MTCTECLQRLDPSAFYGSNRSRCRECVKAAAAARRKADPDAHRQATRRWRAREELRAALLEHVLQIVAARDPRTFHEAVMDAEDALAMEPGATLELFARRTHVTSPKGDTDKRSTDAA